MHGLAIVTWTNNVPCTEVVRIEVVSKMMLYKCYLMVLLIVELKRLRSTSVNQLLVQRCQCQ